MTLRRLQPPEVLVDLLGMKRNTITFLARKGVLPCVKIGKSYRFSLVDVVRHLGIEHVPEVKDAMSRYSEEDWGKAENGGSVEAKN
ncbi:MAG: helix-turn-helix domain-containing protein [Candidatus Lernaella stagnicola]|nr:helix-turn-helix domain-containing protein [Candidatus Lernaella stagnicola]